VIAMRFQPSQHSESDRSWSAIDLKTLEAATQIAGQATTTGIQIGQAVGEAKQSKRDLGRAKRRKKRKKTEDVPTLPPAGPMQKNWVTPAWLIVGTVMVGGLGIFWYVKKGTKAGVGKKQ
jgi:hypothetical protein